MPLPRWLRLKDPAPVAAVPAPSQMPVAVAPDTTPDPDARIHLAAHDPTFPAKREAALAVIIATMDAVIAPFAYARTGTTWVRDSAVGRTAVHLQRNRYGFDATICLRFLPAKDVDLTETPWALDDDVLLDHFGPPDAGRIFYLDVHDDPACLVGPLHILQTQALPWLDAHHSA